MSFDQSECIIAGYRLSSNKKWVKGCNFKDVIQLKINISAAVQLNIPMKGVPP